jgi:sugar phosphate isomerase/epimerase
MKFGFIASNDLDGLEADAKFAAENGFAGLEFNFWANFADLTPETVGKMAAILDRYGVACSSFGLWGWNHTSPDAAEREKSLAMLDRAIGYGATLRAPIFITGGGQTGGDLASNVAAFSQVFPPYIAKMEKNGMRFAAYAVHGNSFFENLDCYQAVWERFPNVGIKFDPLNILGHGEDYIVWLRDCAHRMFEVHIKEGIRMDGKTVSQPAAGMGDIHWGKVMAFLYEVNYDGYLVMEPHGPIWSRGPMKRKMLLLSKKYLSQFML